MRLAKSVTRLLNSGKLNDITDELNAVRQTDYMPTYYRAVVLDVIFDPLMLDDEDLRTLSRLLKNDFFVDSLPRNCVIAQILTSEGEVGYLPEIFFPFFSSHLALPLKAGEQVWVMFEDHSKPLVSGFWLSRIHEPRHVEDVNFTHGDRRWVKYDHEYDFPDGVRVDPDGPRAGASIDQVDAAGNLTLKNQYNTTFETAYSANPDIVGYEAVPRFTKRPGDLVFQGSNNTLISLGQKRAPHPEDDGDETTATIRPFTAEDPVEKCGAIDIVVGRGYVGRTGVVTAYNTRGFGEAAKDNRPGSEYRAEGDPDFVNDRARIYLSMSSTLDEEFNIKLPEEIGVDDRGEEDITNPNKEFGEQSGIAIKADEIRIIARQDIKFVLQNPDVPGPEGTTAITINSNGDIIFIPALKGVIKLGGPDADKAILCGDAPAKIGDDGTVQAAPWVSTALGAIGLGNGNGYIADKILVTGTKVAGS